MRLQFLAVEAKPYFTVEARYEHPKEDLNDVPALNEVRERLDPMFRIGTDGYGYYWARVIEAENWLKADGMLDEILAHTLENIDLLADSGIFTALNELAPTTPPSESPISSEDD